MSDMKFTTLDRILSRVYRSIKNTQIEEEDIIEWAGEALEFLQVYETQEQAVAFIEVENNEAFIPPGFQMVLQIAKDNSWVKGTKDLCSCATEIVNSTISEDEAPTPVPIDENGLPMTGYDLAYYRPFYDTSWYFSSWANNSYYKDNFEPVRLADSTFFNSLVCKERENIPYKNCHSNSEEYTIIGSTTKKFRFSFSEGLIALAYLKNIVDKKTGLPLVPDQISFITAITYYIKFKISESDFFSNREGSVNRMEYARKQWLTYAQQAQNYAKMPKTIDDYQDLLEQTHHMIPRHKRYYGYFGNLNRSELNNYKNI